MFGSGNLVVTAEYWMYVWCVSNAMLLLCNTKSVIFFVQAIDARCFDQSRPIGLAMSG